MNLTQHGYGLSIVLPAYREEQALRIIIPSLKMELDRLATPWEILVVDADHAIDATAELCHEHAVRHLFRSGGNSYGDAIRTGFRECAGAYVIVMDADGSHRPADIQRLWAHREEADLVIGSRYSPGGGTENSAVLVFMSFLVNVMYRLAFRLSIRDVTNSFRLYQGDRVRALKLESDNFEIVEEILIRLVFGSSRSSYLEVPVTFEKRKSGKSKRNLVLFAASYFESIWRLYGFRRRAIAEVRRKVD